MRMNKFYGICFLVLGILSFFMSFFDAGTVLCLMGIAVFTEKKPLFDGTWEK